MEILKVIETTKVKKGCVTGTIEVCNVVKRNVKHSSSDKRAGNWVSDVYETIAFITVNGVKNYFCHTPNGIIEAIDLFNGGEFRKYLPKV
jgi:hypothetical protein